VASDLGETFDAMVEELVDYRLARYLSPRLHGPRSAPQPAYRLKVIHAGGRPILILNRDQNAGLPEGETAFIAGDVACSGNFVKIALNVAHRNGDTRNVLPDLLRSWFGADAGQPGTAPYVGLVGSEPRWEMRPAFPIASPRESVG
jgi:hypothetical protein